MYRGKKSWEWGMGWDGDWGPGLGYVPWSDMET